VQQGDFAAAGSASIEYVRTLPAAFGEVGLGENGFRRVLAAGAPRLGTGTLLVAGEGFRNDGPWTQPQDYRKNNAVLRYAQGTERAGWDVALLAYDARWNATDQVAKRAVDSGLIGRFGTLDPTSGGATSRYSLSAQWAARDDGGAWRANAYAVRYRLDLFSNFTYFLDNPVDGDQFEQADRRTIVGGGLERTLGAQLGGRPVEFTLGARLRQDDIDTVGLYLTAARQRLTTIREDAVTQRAAAAYAEAAVQATDWLRVVAGVRADWMNVDVSSDTPANSGKASDSIVTPKFTAVFGPWSRTEFYANYGQGFHSNDARGATIRVNPDPRSPDFGNPVDPVPLLVRARGEEIGVRSVPLRGWQTSLALWRLKLDSELVFVGDAGTTEANRPSRRQGVEWANYWTPLPGLTVDLDLSYSRARFTDSAPEGNRIPGAIERTAALGVAYDDAGPWFGGLRLRYFGPRPLIEDDSVRTSSSTIVNARLGWRAGKRLEVIADVINLLDRRFNDIEYFYESQLRGESAPVADIHQHPGEPRTVRLSLRLRF
jgi:outer membrane receptor protein involved in Fe transport